MPPHFFQGVGSISAVLKRDGHSTDMIRIGDFVQTEIDEKLSGFNPDIIGISSMSCHFYKIPEIVKNIRTKFTGPIILGGVHATVSPETAIEIPELTGVVVGEGESPVLEFVNCVKDGADYTEIKNFWFKKDGKIIKNPIRRTEDDLDTFPFADRELFDFNDLLSKNPVAEFTCGRGCPFQCSYCINTKWMEIHKGLGKTVRFRSIDNVISEIKEVISNYPQLRQIEFHDDTFTVNKEWLKEFCKAYSKEIKLPFACNVRPGTVNDELPLMLKEANCTEVRIGIEAGSDYIRNKILKRNLSKEDIINVFKKFKDIGIRTWAFNMIGLPYETVSTIEETIELNTQVAPNFAQVSVFTPYPGTETKRICEENGWLSERTTETYFQNETALDQPTLSIKQVAYYNRIFRWRVMYPQFAPFVDILCRIPVGKNRVAYDLVFPFIKKVYRYIKYQRDLKKQTLP